MKKQPGHCFHRVLPIALRSSRLTPRSDAERRADGHFFGHGDSRCSSDVTFPAVLLCLVRIFPLCVKLLQLRTSPASTYASLGSNRLRSREHSEFQPAVHYIHCQLGFYGNLFSSFLCPQDCFHPTRSVDYLLDARRALKFKETHSRHSRYNSNMADCMNRLISLHQGIANQRQTIHSQSARNTPNGASWLTKSSPSFPGFSWSWSEPTIPSQAPRIATTITTATRYGDKITIDGHLSA